MEDDELKLSVLEALDLISGKKSPLLARTAELLSNHEEIESEIKDRFASTLAYVSSRVHANARDKGFWEQEDDVKYTTFIHGEVSELKDALLKGNPPSDKITGFSNAEEECADIVMLVLSLCAARRWNVGEAILAKMAYNRKRPYKHGRE